MQTMDAENGQQDREPFCSLTAEQARILQRLTAELSGPEWDAEQVRQLVEHSSQEIEQDATDDDRRTQGSD
jgi:hypothetical protein